MNIFPRDDGLFGDSDVVLTNTPSPTPPQTSHGGNVNVVRKKSARTIEYRFTEAFFLIIIAIIFFLSSLIIVIIIVINDNDNKINQSLFYRQ